MRDNDFELNSVLVSELKAIYDTRKSFYGKATILLPHQIINFYTGEITTNSFKEIYFLKSYNKLIAYYDKRNDIFYIILDNLELLSNTTLRHLREFMKQFNVYNGETKKELIKKFYYWNFLNK